MGTGLWLNKQDGVLTQVVLGDYPVGTILDYGSATIPPGWLECDGQDVAAYPDLLAALDIAFAGLAPDLRGRSPIGIDATYLMGVPGGSATISAPAHNHSVPLHPHTENPTTPLMMQDNAPDSGAHAHTPTISTNTMPHTHGPADNVSGANESFVWRLDAPSDGPNEIVCQEGTPGMRLYFAGTATGAASSNALHLHGFEIEDTVGGVMHEHTVGGSIDNAVMSPAETFIDGPNHHPMLPVTKIIKASQTNTLVANYEMGEVPGGGDFPNNRLVAVRDGTDNTNVTPNPGSIGPAPVGSIASMTWGFDNSRFYFEIDPDASFQWGDIRDVWDDVTEPFIGGRRIFP